MNDGTALSKQLRLLLNASGAVHIIVPRVTLSEAAATLAEQAAEIGRMRDLFSATLGPDGGREASPATAHQWRRIHVPTLHDQGACLPDDGGLVILFDGDWYLGRFEGETMTWHYDDGSSDPISDFVGAWWHPLPDPAPTFRKGE